MEWLAIVILLAYAISQWWKLITDQRHRELLRRLEDINEANRAIRQSLFTLVSRSE